MFEVGWSEMLVIAIVMIVVVGPKDLPNMLRTMGRMAAKARGMANDFRRQFDEALKEAELDDIKKSVDQIRGMNPMNEVRKQLNPFEKAAADVRAGVEGAMKPQPAPKVEAADAPAQPAEPLKNGAIEIPGEGSAANVTPAFPVMTDSSVPPAELAAAVPAKAPRKTAKSTRANGAKAPAVATPTVKPATKAKANGAGPSVAKAEPKPAAKPAAAKAAPAKPAATKAATAKSAAKPVAAKSAPTKKASAKRAAK